MIIEAVVGACVLLGIGALARLAFPVLRRFLVPASVLGGLVGLVVVQVLARTMAPESAASLPAEPVDAGALESIARWTDDAAGLWRSWPGILIAIVFAGLLLERPTDAAATSRGSGTGARARAGAGSATDLHRASGAARGRAALQGGLMVWVIVLGHIALGLAAGTLLFAGHPEVPASAGQLLEATFPGGHGTGGGMGILWSEAPYDWPQGLDLAMVLATVGLMVSIFAGLVLANVGVRRGWTRDASSGASSEGGPAPAPVPSPSHEHRTAPPIAFGTIRPDILDPLAFQAVLLGVALGLGMLFQTAFTSLVALVDHPGLSSSLGNVPLFLFTLFGGWALRGVLTAFGAAHRIDTASIKRLGAIAMEFLIVAAIASLRIEAVLTYAVPLIGLALVGLAWATCCLVVLAPRMLPRGCWFELGLINFGMSTGTTAQGMMLLRTVDPDLESGAAETYALAAPLSAPFVGGGAITFALPAIIAEVGPWPAIGGAIVVAVVCGTWAMRLARVRPAAP